MLKVGLAENLVHTRFSPTALPRASYLTAVATGMDSFWLPDHLNSLLPRAVITPKYVGAARLIPDVDAYLEPWTMLGNFAARNRFGRLRLGTAVTDVGRRNPAVTAQAAATLHLITRGRAILGIGTGEREGNEPYGWTGRNRWRGSKKPWRPSGRCGTPAVNSSAAIHRFSRCTMRYSRCPPTAASGRKFGSPPMGHACCGPPAATPTRGFPRSISPAQGLRGRPGKGPGGRLRRRPRSAVHHRRQLAVRGDRRQPRTRSTKR